MVMIRLSTFSIDKLGYYPNTIKFAAFIAVISCVLYNSDLHYQARGRCKYPSITHQYQSKCVNIVFQAHSEIISRLNM